MKIKRIAFVGIPVTDMKRARAFYEGVLGLKATMESGEGSFVEYTTDEGTVSLGSMGDRWLPSEHGTCAALEVENFDEAITKLREASVPFTMDPYETPVCHMAMVQDPDGNKLMIHKLKAED
ncbi:MAG: VOC family protein [Chthoniobacterales bacterium]